MGNNSSCRTVKVSYSENLASLGYTTDLFSFASALKLSVKSTRCVHVFFSPDADGCTAALALKDAIACYTLLECVEIRTSLFPMKCFQDPLDAFLQGEGTGCEVTTVFLGGSPKAYTTDDSGPPIERVLPDGCSVHHCFIIDPKAAPNDAAFCMSGKYLLHHIHPNTARSTLEEMYAAVINGSTIERQRLTLGDRIQCVQEQLDLIKSRGVLGINDDPTDVKKIILVLQHLVDVLDFLEPSPTEQPPTTEQQREDRGQLIRECQALQAKASHRGLECSVDTDCCREQRLSSAGLVWFLVKTTVESTDPTMEIPLATLREMGQWRSVYKVLLSIACYVTSGCQRDDDKGIPYLQTTGAHDKNLPGPAQENERLLMIFLKLNAGGGPAIDHFTNYDWESLLIFGSSDPSTAQWWETLKYIYKEALTEKALTEKAPPPPSPHPPPAYSPPAYSSQNKNLS